MTFKPSNKNLHWHMANHTALMRLLHNISQRLFQWAGRWVMDKSLIFIVISTWHNNLIQVIHFSTSGFWLAMAYIWEHLCQKQVSRAGTSNYIPQYLWDVITCPCPWYLLLAQSPHIKSLLLLGIPGFSNVLYNGCKAWLALFYHFPQLNECLLLA